MIALGIETVSVDPAFDTGPQHANQNDVERELSALTAEPDRVNGLATRAPTVDRSPGTSPAVAAHHLNATRAPQSADVPRIGPGPFAMRTKRWFDLVVATLMLLPVLPLAALIA